MNKKWFLEYLKRHLLPVLKKRGRCRDVLSPMLCEGDMVVCDHLPAHKSAVAKELIEVRGATLLPLPPYSPDLNPIELSFAKLKSVLRKEKIREVDKLKRFLRRSPKLFSKNECKNYFKHAGYTV